jgi:hypothetical protein
LGPERCGGGSSAFTDSIVCAGTGIDCSTNNNLGDIANIVAIRQVVKDSGCNTGYGMKEGTLLGLEYHKSNGTTRLSVSRGKTSVASMSCAKYGDAVKKDYPTGWTLRGF